MLSGKIFKAKCDIERPIEFDCEDKNWTCEKCLKTLKGLQEWNKRDLQSMKKQLKNLPIKIKRKKTTIKKTEKDIKLIKKYLR